MMKYKIIEDKNTPFGFSIEPDDKKTFEKIKYQMHLDSSYVRFSIWIYSRCIHYLFDKHKNHITWEQRQKEISTIPIEEKVFDDGYKVVRKREIKLGDDEFNDGREYIVDILYLNEKFETSKREIELYPMDKIYNDYIEVRKSQDSYVEERRTNQTKYLDENTSKEERIKILYEEVACRTAMLAYHPMVRDSDALFDMRDYKEYKKLYFSNVPNKEENYIEYLKAYFTGLRESTIDDINGDEELKIIKEKCKEANLLDIYNRYMKNDK